MHNFAEDLYRLSRDLLSEIECLDSLVIRSQSSGGNNKIFILEIDGIPKYVMKHYFRHVSDPKDRCRAEWTFLEYARHAGISCVPKPIVCDPKKGIAIIEFINGHKVLAEQLSWDHISQALDFFESLNQEKDSNTSKYCLNAAESCLSMRDHLVSVNRRISRLLQIDKESEIDRSAYHFIRYELIPQWEKVQTGILNQEKKGIFKIDETISDKDICISPSDFGFHNAIETDQGILFFIDFEYAGRDDPVKMICDFFCQPEVPIPHSYLPMFSTRVLERLDNPESHYHRMKILLPVHTIKWCCIILNEFLPVGRARRIFAHEDLNIDEIKHKQLEKARNLFKTVGTMI
jgi:thiamine kinase-like enzyme